MNQNIVSVNKVGYFQLILDSSKVQSTRFLVKYFSLNKQINKPVICYLQLVCGVQITDNSQYADGLLLFDLYTKQQILNIHCKLIQVVSKQRITWFSGYIAGINPALSSAGSNTQTRTHISCIGDQMDLMFSPVKDFAYVPVASAALLPTLDRLSKSNGTNLLFNQYQSIPFTYKDIIGVARQRATDDIATLLCEFNQAINTKIKSPNSKIHAGVQLQNYIQSKTCLTKDIRSDKFMLIAKNPYIQALNTSYLAGITQKTVWDGLLAAIGDKYLQLVPPSISQLNTEKRPKYKILPNYPNSLPKYTIYNDDLIGITLSSNPLQQLSIPDLIAVNVKPISQYQSDSSNKEQQDIAGGLYGVYPDPNTFDKQQHVKLKIINAPNWLLNICNIELEPSINNTQNRSPKTTQAGTQQNIDSMRSNLQSIKSIIDTYAKSIFYYLYASHKGATLKLPYSDTGRYIDGYLGQSICLNINNIVSVSKAADSLLLYCMMNAVNYQYKAADILNQSTSSFDITVSVTQLVSKGSRFQSIYTKPLANTIYYMK